MQDDQMTNSNIMYKRYKQEQRLEEEKKQQEHRTEQKLEHKETKNSAKTPFFTRKLRAEVERVWRASEHGNKQGCLLRKEEEWKNIDMKVVPAFKVGTLEMYKRFPDAYDALMQRHDCSAINEYLHDTILPRLLSSRRHKQHIEAPNKLESKEDQSVLFPALSVMDVGCGTGRIASMLAQSPHVQHFYAYDIALPMLQRCVVNVAKSVASSSVSHSLPLQSTTHNSISECKVRTKENTRKNEELVNVDKAHNDHLSCALYIEYLSATHETSEELYCSKLSETNSNEQAKQTSLTALPWTNLFYQCNTTCDKSEKLHLHSKNINSKDNVTKTLHLQLCSYHDIMEGCFTRHAHSPVSLIVCAWSLSYVMRESWNDTCKWQDAVRRIITELLTLLETSQSSWIPQQEEECEVKEQEPKTDNSHDVPCTSSALVIIETLGTNSIGPSRQNVMMEWLVEEFGFELKWVQTDYHFRSIAEAVRLTHFFFGSSMSELMAQRQTSLQSSATEQSPVLHECTGIWTLWKK